MSTAFNSPNDEILVKVKLINSGDVDARNIVFNAAPPEDCEFDPCGIGVLGSTTIHFDILSARQTDEWRIGVINLLAGHWAEFEFYAKSPALNEL